MSTISADGKTNALYPANAAYVAGVVLRQDVEDPYIDTTIDKVSLNLTVTATDRTTVVEGLGDTISFQASNWQNGRDQWVFQPVDHAHEGFTTSGTAIENTLQPDDYSISIDAVNNAPYLKYDLVFPARGNYDIWGFGYVSGTGIFWGFNGDTTHLRQFTLGDHSSGWERVPRWTKFGSVYVEAGGLYSFEVYLSDRSNIVILDQWYFTSNLEFETQLHAEDYLEPLDLSTAPYMTALRLNDGANTVTAWLSSVNIPSSGKYNYEIRNSDTLSGILFDVPLSIEFWQIGGNKDNFAAWNYIFSDDSVGDAFISIDYGQTYMNLQSNPSVYGESFYGFSIYS
jgi:hypothetical protein